MPPLVVLGTIPIPEQMVACVPDAMNAWPRERREVWEIRANRSQGASGAYPGHYLEPAVEEFLTRTLRTFGCSAEEAKSNSLVVFGEVEPHSDEGLQCNRRAGSYFHLVLQGSGTLRLPNVRDKSLRSLDLTPGLAFVLNPNVRHAVTNVAPGDLATLSAVVPRRFWDSA